MSDTSHPSHDPYHPAAPEPTAHAPASLEGGGFGTPAYSQHGPLPPQAGYPEYGAYGSPHPQQAFHPPGTAPRRPGTVLAGCILAWVGSVFGVLVGLLLLSVSEDSPLFDEVDLGMSRADAVDAMHLAGGFLAGWCLVVAVMAVLAFRGVKWAAIALVVMAGLMVVLSLLSMVGSGGIQSLVGLLWSVGSAALIYLNRPAKAWFEAKAAAKRMPAV
jgi:hypothetical protein